jgi:hypothetical protein
MRKKTLMVWTLAVLLAVVWGGRAQAAICQSEKKTYVFFGNGMFNDKEATDKSRRELQRRMQQTGSLQEDEWVFELSYNHDEGLYSLFEVYRQREGESATAFWRWVANLEIVPDWFRDAASNILFLYNRTEALIDADLRRHVQRYHNVLLEGNRVLVVSHSQGNLYANAAHGNLSGTAGVPMEAFGIVSVASPSSYVAGGGLYFTRNDDLVINTVRLSYPDTLPGNISNANFDPDWKHHGFIESYLGGNVSGPSIVLAALARAEGLAWPQPQMGSGPITVTLTWGAQPDVDLHVYEPNGFHVYYSSMSGPSGYLDVDNVTGYGPEHYYVISCDTLETGIYRVGVNYYYGTAPETAMLQVQAGDIVRNFTTYLPAARGSGGNNSPVPVARIEVTGVTPEEYSFTVGSAGF